MAIKTTRLKRDIDKLIKDDPITVHRFVLLMKGDGHSDAASYSHLVSWPYSWISSWQGRLDTLGREVWQEMGSEAGVAIHRSFTVLLPYMASGHPQVDDMIELYDSDRNNLGEFRVMMCVAYSYKTEVNVQLTAPGEGIYG